MHSSFKQYIDIYIDGTITIFERYTEKMLLPLKLQNCLLSFSSLFFLSFHFLFSPSLLLFSFSLLFSLPFRINFMTQHFTIFSPFPFMNRNSYLIVITFSFSHVFSLYFSNFFSHFSSSCLSEESEKRPTLSFMFNRKT